MAETAQQRQKIPVIIDTDPGVDDILAILLALASPEIDVRAIIITFGNTDVEACHLNILRLSSVLSRQFDFDPQSWQRFPNVNSKRRIILARGANVPLEGEIHSAQYFHGRDGLGGITERHPEWNIDPRAERDYLGIQQTDKAGIDVALDIINSEPARSVSYIVLGPMTTLAHLVRAHGDVIRSKIGQVVCMGGALDVPGNTSPVAEFNFFADPYAVRELLEPSDPSMGLPLDRFLLVPLDITTPHELPFPFYETRVDPTFASTKGPSSDHNKAPLIHFTSAFFDRTREVMLAFGKDAMELHDIVAVWCAIENAPSLSATPSLALRNSWKAVPRRFQVERAGELTRGMLVVDRREDEGAYDPGANRAAVQAELEKSIFQTTGILESNAIPAQIEVETQLQSQPNHPAGVPVIVKTPGPAALLKLLTERVWGIRV